MIDDPNPRTDPMPPGTAGTLDYSRITQHLGDMLADDDGWHFDLEHNKLSWALEPFDALGQAQVSVIHNPTGQIIAGCRLHWSALA